MAKHLHDIENPMLTLIETHKRFRKPSIEVDKQSDNMCKCGCGNEIVRGLDSYVIIDDMLFLEDSCVTEYFIKEAGGRRVYGGAC